MRTLPRLAAGLSALLLTGCVDFSLRITPENLSVVEAAAELPLLRPLIGMDKIEITEQAQQIGSFTTSIEPDQDCCKLFVPLHPSTKTKLDDILRIERGLEISAFVKQGVEKAELSTFTFPS